MKRKNENGITLIALVVTIIILLILAGVTIGFAMNGSGLFDKAKSATEEYNNKAKEESTTLANYENEIDDYISGARNTYTNNYSLKEQEVGTWIDGKTIYQMSFENVSIATGNNKEFLTMPDGITIDTIISCKFAQKMYGTNRSLCDEGKSSEFYCEDGRNIISNSANGKVATGVFTIQYTKGTYLTESNE